MMEKVYTSTGIKLVHHPRVLERLKNRMATPVSLQVAPTARCNLNCSFCSNSKRTMHEDLDYQTVVELLERLARIGLKTVEWTGGGDPTMYKHINSVIFNAHIMDLDQGLITNGVLLKDEVIRPDVLGKLKWIRISMNSLDYVDRLDLSLKGFKGTLGFSYVMHETSQYTLPRLQDYVLKYQPAYVRIVTNCLATHEEQEENNRKYTEMVEEMGSPYFYQAKRFDTPKQCWWNYIKPFVLHDGWVYPCSSVVLNSGSEGKFHEKYRWVKIEDLPNVYDKVMEPYPTNNCDHCVFKYQNEIVGGLINPTGHQNFV